MSEKFISYLRLSRIQKTRSSGIEYDQNNSLGLDAQRHSVNRHITSCQGELVYEYCEVESGTKKKRHKRVMISKAIEHCKAIGATLIIARLDRLARDVEFTAMLTGCGVKFICCDNPNATHLTIHILAAVAQDEAEKIAIRVKAALAQKKIRGESLGWRTHSVPVPKWQDSHRDKSSAVRKEKRSVDKVDRRAACYAYHLRMQGMTYRRIAQEMENSGFASKFYASIHPTTIKRWLEYHKEFVQLSSTSSDDSVATVGVSSATETPDSVVLLFDNSLL
jgi:DNA invertase Pin-like site-specific DNA recombinase